jgi:hypothetical protein
MDRYPELPGMERLNQAVCDLTAYGMLHDSTQLNDLRKVLSLASLDELRRLALTSVAGCRQLATEKKEALIERLVSSSHRQRTLTGQPYSGWLMERVKSQIGMRFTR